MCGCEFRLVPHLVVLRYMLPRSVGEAVPTASSLQWIAPSVGSCETSGSGTAGTLSTLGDVKTLRRPSRLHQVTAASALQVPAQVARVEV